MSNTYVRSTYRNDYASLKLKMIIHYEIFKAI